jgi:hypothetical protein
MKNKEIFIDFTDSSLKEIYSLASLGGKIKLILWSMFGSTSLDSPNVRVRGTKEQLSAFAAALAAEGGLMKAMKKHGLNDPRVQGSKTSLAMAVSNFERDTGVIWPFK